MKTEVYHGYILKIIPYGDSDAVLTLFTREAGRISVFVKGIKTSKKRFAGSIDKYLYNEFEVVPKKNNKLSILKNSKIINPLYNLKITPVKLIVAEHIFEIYENLSGQYEVYDFDFFNDTLNFIDKMKSMTYSDFLILRFNILKKSGIMPDINFDEERFFSLNNFNFHKFKREDNVLELSKKQINFLLGYQRKDDSVLNFEFNDEEKKKFGKMFSVLYYSVSNKKLLTIPLLKRFF